MTNLLTSNLDLDIKEIDKNIFENIERSTESDRGFLSQNILKELRDLIEHTAVKILSIQENVELEITYENIGKALDNIKNNGNYRFLSKFHRFVQNSVGHRTPNQENAERLMLKYYEHLLKLKEFHKINFGEDILQNINKFPLNTDKSYYEYYGEIANKINSIRYSKDKAFKEGRFYIQKIKPFFIDNHIYYEITLSPTTDKLNKSDRITMFSKFNIDTNYSVKISTTKLKAKIFGTDTVIQIIDSWKISIRPCEIKNFLKFFGIDAKFNTENNEYGLMMKYLTTTRNSLLDLAESSDEYYKNLKEYFIKYCKKMYIFDMLDCCRNIIKKRCNGTNVIKYLLHNFNNRIIKKQYMKAPNPILNNLYMNYGCIPFDQMPFTTSLINHNPVMYDLLECFEVAGRKHELLARYILNNTEQNGMLYTDLKELDFFENPIELIEIYNSKLYIPKHEHRKILIEDGQVFFKGYEENTIAILKKLQELSSEGIAGFKNSVNFWIDIEGYNIDDENKKEIMLNLFENSRVALIYGSAGTGKTYMIKHIANYYSDERKIFLANTHPAVENLKRRIKAPNSEFYTIEKVLRSNEIDRECDVLIIDECSTVSNKDMLRLLRTFDFKEIVLVGDIYQIESISFGNWFNIAKILIKKQAKFELLKPYRSQNENLKELWDKVRNVDEEIKECIVRNKYSEQLGKDILINEDSDEIILCLNYDGLYGINNINRFMQNSNLNESIDWGIGTYKIGDPILFNESNRFYPIIYNNLKGKIINIEKDENKIWFSIEIDTSITKDEAEKVGLIWLGNTETKTLVKFYVFQYKELDEDDDDLNSESVVPFNIAYAVSIHKSQGLEYNSVKIIITQEIEEVISHNIFYTAITRAMNKLKIYWTPECEERIIKSLKQKFNAKDACIVRNKMKQI